MGAKTTNKNKIENTNSDGHLLGYQRDSFVRGKGATAGGIIASGGTILYNGDYTIHQFTESGTFSVSSVGSFGDTVDVLVVAGGGAAGSGHWTPAGGAGGVAFLPEHNIATGNYTVSVGGGSATTPHTTTAPNGSDSSLVGILTARGGGGARGASSPAPDGRPGGSGGANSGLADPYPVPAQAIAYGNPGSPGSGGGGGGAGSAGSTTNPAGNSKDGGIGVDFSPYFGTSVGDSGWFGGGGGGGGASHAGDNWPAAAGGTGGGGNGSNSSNGSPGGTNTGGGGGGCGYNGGFLSGGNGGPGTVLIRYKSRWI